MQTKEEKREYNRLYRLRNKEKFNDYHKKYYAENKEKLKEIASKCYQKTKVKRNKQAKEYREKNLEKVKKMQKDWYLNNPEKVKEQKLKKEYGISLEQYDEMFRKQKSSCAICGTHQDDLKLKLSVDHCHETKKVRGLLCGKCNRGIGFLNDDANIVSKALDYLLIGVE